MVTKGGASMEKIKYNLDKIQHLRKINGLTQEDVAELLGLTKAGYHNKEKGARKFTLSEAQMLADIYNTTIEDIFFSETDNQSVNKDTA